VVLVEFAIKPGLAETAHTLILENAAQSLRDEPGCWRFDVTVAPDDPLRITLYEIYESPAAFETHLRMPHFLKFAEATRDMFASRSIRQLDLLSPEPETRS
jgi:quinol monooxygenase YgiN